MSNWIPINLNLHDLRFRLYQVTFSCTWFPNRTLVLFYCFNCFVLVSIFSLKSYFLKLVILLGTSLKSYNAWLLLFKLLFIQIAWQYNLLINPDLGVVRQQPVSSLYRIWYHANLFLNPLEYHFFSIQEVKVSIDLKGIFLLKVILPQPKVSLLFRF